MAIIDMEKAQAEDAPSSILDKFEREFLATFREPVPYRTLEHVYARYEQTCRCKQVNRKALYLRKGVFDTIRDEFLPLLALADKLYSDRKYLFDFPRGRGVRGAYDLRIEHDGRYELVEITHARDGQRDRLQMELLVRNGHATVSGKLWREDGNACEDPCAIDHRQAIADAQDWIARVLGKKAAKKASAETSLLCAIDEWDFFIRSARDYAAIVQAAQKVLPALEYKAVYLCGSRDKGWMHRLR